MVYTLPAIDTVLAYCLSLLILLRERAEWHPACLPIRVTPQQNACCFVQQEVVEPKSQRICRIRHLLLRRLRG